MNINTAKRWFSWHKWTSLICTVFLLLLCITGLPLIFHHEIEDIFSEVSMGDHHVNQKLSQDTLLKIAELSSPGRQVRFAFWDQEEHPDQVLFDLAEDPLAPFEESKYVLLHEYTGSVLGEPKNEGFMYWMYRLHTDVFLGIGGKLFMGLMGILFLISIISGIVLYGPIMRKYEFGMVRKHRAKRLKWLDTHNLLGIVTMTWLLVVGFTGVINTLSDVIVVLWQQGQLAEMTADYRDLPKVESTYASIDLAVQTAEEKLPEMETLLIAFPGTAFSSNHHYAVFMKGRSELTSRLLMPVLIDAATGEFTDARKMPWFVTALFISQPLHFGDYGGLPLKIIWTILDIASIIILITGVYLWYLRRKATLQFKSKTTTIHEKQAIE